MQKGDIRNLVEADVYAVLLDIEEKAGTGQTGR